MRVFFCPYITFPGRTQQEFTKGKMHYAVKTSSSECPEFLLHVCVKLGSFLGKWSGRGMGLGQNEEGEEGNEGGKMITANISHKTAALHGDCSFQDFGFNAVMNLKKPFTSACGSAFVPRAW